MCVHAHKTQRCRLIDCGVTFMHTSTHALHIAIKTCACVHVCVCSYELGVCICMSVLSVNECVHVC